MQITTMNDIDFFMGVGANLGEKCCLQGGFWLL